MKRYINTLFIGLGVLLASTSCDDEFLNKTDPTVLVSDNFYQTETQLVQAVNGVYGQLRPWHLSQWQYTEFISDNTTLHFKQGEYEYSTVGRKESAAGYHTTVLLVVVAQGPLKKKKEGIWVG